jgi:hypothetical protein
LRFDDRPLAKRDVQKIFAFRQQTLQQIFPSVASEAMAALTS